VFTGFWLGGPKGRDHWEDIGVGGTIIFRWTLGRWDRWGQLYLAGSGQSLMASFCNHGNEPSGSIKEAD